MQHVYHYPSIGKIDDLVVTDSREKAKQCIQKGYTLFTVPQMFGLEEGLFTLFLEDQHHTANNAPETSAKAEVPAAPGWNPQDSPGLVAGGKPHATAIKMSKEAADHVLSDFEKSIRDQYSAGLKY